MCSTVTSYTRHLLSRRWEVSSSTIFRRRPPARSSGANSSSSIRHDRGRESEQSALARIGNQLCAVTRSKLLHDRAQIRLHGVERQMQFFADLWVGITGGD